VPNIDGNYVSIIGSILMPRMGFQPKKDAQGYYNLDDPNFDVQGPTDLLNLPFIDIYGEYNLNVKLYEQILGIGIGLNGINAGSVFEQLYNGTDFYNKDINGAITGSTIYGLNATWDYGDNSTLAEPIISPYAIDLAKRDGSTANSFGIQAPYTQAIDSQYTYGAFINSCFNLPVTTSFSIGTGIDVLETSIYDITDELNDLIANSVYSSFMKGDPNEYTTSIGSTTHYKANQFNGKFYYFGRYAPNNALIDIQNFYKISK
jgi:hypothetical protein